MVRQPGICHNIGHKHHAVGPCGGEQQRVLVFFLFHSAHAECYHFLAHIPDGRHRKVLEHPSVNVVHPSYDHRLEHHRYGAGCHKTRGYFPLGENFHLSVVHIRCNYVYRNGQVLYVSVGHILPYELQHRGRVEDASSGSGRGGHILEKRLVGTEFNHSLGFYSRRMESRHHCSCTCAGKYICLHSIFFQCLKSPAMSRSLCPSSAEYYSEMIFFHNCQFFKSRVFSAKMMLK